MGFLTGRASVQTVPLLRPPSRPARRGPPRQARAAPAAGTKAESASADRTEAGVAAGDDTTFSLEERRLRVPQHVRPAGRAPDRLLGELLGLHPDRTDRSGEGQPERAAVGQAEAGGEDAPNRLEEEAKDEPVQSEADRSCGTAPRCTSGRPTPRRSSVRPHPAGVRGRVDRHHVRLRRPTMARAHRRSCPGRRTGWRGCRRRGRITWATSSSCGCGTRRGGDTDTVKLADGTEACMLARTLTLECPRGQTGHETISTTARPGCPRPSRVEARKLLRGRPGWSWSVTPSVR